MRRGERRGHGGALGKAALEEQPPQPNGGTAAAAVERTPPPPPGAERDGPGPGLRRSTESEVYDDGTNTFFW